VWKGVDLKADVDGGDDGISGFESGRGLFEKAEGDVFPKKHPFCLSKE